MAPIGWISGGMSCEGLCLARFLSRVIIWCSISRNVVRPCDYPIISSQGRLFLDRLFVRFRSRNPAASFGGGGVAIGDARCITASECQRLVRAVRASVPSPSRSVSGVRSARQQTIGLIPSSPAQARATCLFGFVISGAEPARAAHLRGCYLTNLVAKLWWKNTRGMALC